MGVLVPLGMCVETRVVLKQYRHYTYQPNHGTIAKPNSNGKSHYSKR